jgi:hypothetical protein
MRRRWSGGRYTYPGRSAGLSVKDYGTREGCRGNGRSQPRPYEGVQPAQRAEHVASGEALRIHCHGGAATPI